MAGLSLRSWLKDLVESERVVRFADRVPEGRVLTEGQPRQSETFATGDSYLTLRLAEMYLRQDRQLWRQKMPVAVTICDLFYAGEERSLPFLISHETLKESLAQLGAEDSPVELYDTRLLGPVPLLTPEVALFSGLFAGVRTDHLALLLDVVGELGTTAGIVSLASGVPLARQLYESVGRLLRLNEKEFRFGTRQVFSVIGGGAPLLRSGYLVVSSAQENELGADELWAVDGRLLRGTERPERPLREFDYCLIAIDYEHHRKTFVDLAFHRDWLILQERILAGSKDWRDVWLSLVAKIRTSHDLTAADKTVALATYKDLRDQELAIFKDAEPVEATRGEVRRRPILALVAAAMAKPSLATREGKHVSRACAVDLAEELSREDAVDWHAQAMRARITEQFGSQLPDPDALAYVMVQEELREAAI